MERIKKILLTGANGYIGKRLLPVLVENGYDVVCGVRDINRFNLPASLKSKVDIIQIDLLNKDSLNRIPKDIDGAYYLVHSMSSSKEYEKLEKESAVNFRVALDQTAASHVVYLSGIINDSVLSKHLSSRKSVEEELGKGGYNLTTLRAGIIIGSGSASFEIIRDLVEKLPIMVTPKWLKTKSQPISVSDVISFLVKTIFIEKGFNKDFDIGGPDILSYKDMLLEFASVRNLKRKIIIIPVMTPRMSSYWLYFVTSTSYDLAVALVNSMKIEVICRDNYWADTLGIKTRTYNESLKRAFRKIESNEIISSWKDAMSSGTLDVKISDFINIPSFGCYTDKRGKEYKDLETTINRIWKIGGNNGWYYGNWLWRFRGFLDKIVGGVGLRRGRKSKSELNSGDAVDFWRVLYADKKEGRLLLFAEMKLPGEAWLEFRIKGKNLVQTATFRPKGIMGRLYWFVVSPFHNFIFNGMLDRLSASKQ